MIRSVVFRALALACQVVRNPLAAPLLGLTLVVSALLAMPACADDILDLTSGAGAPKGFSWPRENDPSDYRMKAPKLSRLFHMTGSTRIEFVVGLDGKTSNVRLIATSGKEEFDQTLLSQASHQLYYPALLNGKPVSVRVVEFADFQAARGVGVHYFLGQLGDDSVCNAETPEAVVAACTAKIDKGQAVYPSYIFRGYANIRLARYQQALDDFKAAATGETKNAEALRGRGFAYENLGDLDKALADYSAAISAQPSFAASLVDRALVYQKLGKTDLALADYHAAVSAATTCIPLHIREDQHCSTSYDAQIGALNDAIKKNPDDLDAYAKRCMQHALANSQLTTALFDCNHVLDRSANNVAVLDARALTFFRMDMLSDAIQDEDAALAANPDMPTSLYLRGVAKLRAGDKTGGEADILAARRVDNHVATNMAFSGVFPALQ